MATTRLYGAVSSIDTDQRSGLAIVAETTAAIAAAPDLEQALRTLIAGMQRLTDADSGGVRLLNVADQTAAGCRLLFWRGGDTYAWQELAGESGTNVDAVVTTGVPQYSADLAALADGGDALASAAHYRDGLGSSLIVPLRSQGLVIGTLHADSHGSAAFRSELLVPLQVLADHAGGAVARTQAEVRRQYAGQGLDVHRSLGCGRLTVHQLWCTLYAAVQWIGAIRCNSAGCPPSDGDVPLSEAGALADNPKRSVARDSLRALAERMAEECRLEQPLAEACELKFRVWEAGRRTEDWRLIVVRRGSGREYQVRTWADWERIKQLAGDWSTRSS